VSFYEEMHMATVAELREFLVWYFEEKRDFRRSTAERIAERHPEQVGKNLAYADSIGLMIDFIAALPEDDSRLQRLVACPAIYQECSGMFEFPSVPEGGASGIDSWAIHIGPRGRTLAPEDVDDEFTDFVDCVLEEAPGIRTEADAWPEKTPWWS
jgi:hypothetical protein